MIESWFVPVVAGLFGLTFGSFLNVCSLRWPEDERFRVKDTHLTTNQEPPGYPRETEDWMHEREWRIRGDLELPKKLLGTLDDPQLPRRDWWWAAVVPSESDAHTLLPLVRQVRVLASDTGVLYRYSDSDEIVQLQTKM